MGEMLSAMESKTIAITTLGCKVNQYESATIEETLREKGHRIVNFKTEADVYIINTCTVTHKTDYQSRQMIRRAQKKEKPHSAFLISLHLSKYQYCLCSTRMAFQNSLNKSWQIFATHSLVSMIAAAVSENVI